MCMNKVTMQKALKKKKKIPKHIAKLVLKKFQVDMICKGQVHEHELKSNSEFVILIKRIFC